MQYTSAEAAKLLRKLNEEHTALLTREDMSASFVAAIEEDVESVRPEYSFAETQEKLAELEEKIRRVKHAVNCFNTTQVIPEINMTIDQALVYIPQLSMKKSRLDAMKSRLPKQREQSHYPTKAIIEYRYANYDIEEAEKEFEKISEELSRVQTALDLVNSTVKFEIDI